MAVDIFLKIGDLVGESMDATHKDKIDVLAWSWGASNSGTTHLGGGGGAGKANVQDLSITKYIDNVSPDLLLRCCSGKHYADAHLIVRKAGDTPLEYFKLDMTEVLISSVSTGGSGGEDRLTENLTLNFAKGVWTYTPQKPDGTGGKENTLGWDILKNEKAG